MQNLIDLSVISIQKVDEICNLALEIMDNPQKFQKSLDGKVIASLFFEPSTRTNLSFSAAAHRLGASVIGFSDANSSSITKGESLADTICAVSSYADILVMRHNLDGSAKLASLYSNCPVINAGDGKHLHPTQTLTDLVTIKKYRGNLNNMVVGLCGDLKFGRTVHSLIKSLYKYENIKFILISPKQLMLPKDMLDFLNNNNISYEITEDLANTIEKLDVLYMTRIQKERFPSDFKLEENPYILTKDMLNFAKKDMLILHPLPRVDEISTDVDADDRALYFKQVKCGMYARMALMLTMSSNNYTKEHIKTVDTHKKCKNPKCVTNVYKNVPIISENICIYCDKEMN